MKRINIKCPYCGSRALLRPASVVYGAKAADPNAPYYVCARYPAFDAYVAAHRGAHGHSGGWDAAPPAALNRLWESGLMSKRQAYLWLQAKLELPEAETHIGKFSAYRCEQVIRLCSSLFPAAHNAA